MSRRPLRRPAPAVPDTWAQAMMRQLAADRQDQEAAEAPERPRQVVVRVCLGCRRQFVPERLERYCPECEPDSSS